MTIFVEHIGRIKYRAFEFELIVMGTDEPQNRLKIRITAEPFDAGVSVYVSERPEQEGGADSTARVFIDGGMRLKCEGHFFELATKYGNFHAEEIILAGSAEAQNIFSGSVAEHAAGIYFMPLGWKTHTWCCATCGPGAAAGGFAAHFSGEAGGILAKRSGALGEAYVNAQAKLSFGADCEVSVRTKKGGAASREVLLAPQATITGRKAGACIMAREEGAARYEIYSANDGAMLECLEELDWAKSLPVDKKSPLNIYPPEFTKSLAISYFAPQRGRARVEMADLMGTQQRMLVDEITQTGAHEIIISGAGMKFGHWIVKYYFEGAKIAEKDCIRKV